MGSSLNRDDLYIAKFYNKELFFKIAEIIRKEFEKNELSRSFIQGILDAKGCVYIRKRDLNIDVEINIANKNVDLLRSIAEYLSKHSRFRSLYEICSLSSPERELGKLAP